MCEEAAPFLTNLVAHPDTQPEVRSEALQVLQRVPRIHLRNVEIIERLMSAYNRLENHKEKRDLIVCVAAWSPRALPFLVNILESEVDLGIRQQAAGGLAAWNVKRGVAELIAVLDKCKQSTEADRNSCNDAGKAFLWLNIRKGWGFPEERIRQDILARTNLSNEEMSAFFVAEIQKWWGENEHRFPDWKPDDPLPDIPPVRETEAEPHADDR